MYTPIKKNRGMVTLLTAIVILVLLSIMVIFATKVGLFDQRMSANEARYKEAFTTAEAGLDFAVQKFDYEFRKAGINNTCGVFTATNTMRTLIIALDGQVKNLKTDGTTKSADTPWFSVDVTLTPACTALNEDIVPLIQFTSTGTGADGTGTATIWQQVSMAKALPGGAPDVPIIVDGSVATGGDYNIVANPNGGGPGVPVSIWTPVGTDVEMGGSSATCHREFYVGNNPQCSNPSGKSETLSKGETNLVLAAYDSTRPDILPNDPGFPPDLFAYLFGVSRVDWTSVKAKAANHNQVQGNCTGLDATAGATYPIWWIEGDCGMGPNQVIGSIAEPVILIIDDHELDMEL